MDAWEILAAIYAETQDPKLGDVDKLVWERHHDRRFGGSLLASQGADLKSDDPALLEALKRFPDEPQFAHVAVECAKREGKPTTDALSRCVAAEFAHMASYRDTQMGFMSLKKELEGAAKK